jgi:hypothetical protein
MCTEFRKTNGLEMRHQNHDNGVVDVAREAV